MCCRGQGPWIGVDTASADGSPPGPCPCRAQPRNGRSTDWVAGSGHPGCVTLDWVITPGSLFLSLWNTDLPNPISSGSIIMEHRNVILLFHYGDGYKCCHYPKHMGLNSPQTVLSILPLLFFSNIKFSDLNYSFFILFSPSSDSTYNSPLLHKFSHMIFHQP